MATPARIVVNTSVIVELNYDLATIAMLAVAIDVVALISDVSSSQRESHDICCTIVKCN